MQKTEESKNLFLELKALDSSARDDDLTTQAEWEGFLGLVRTTRRLLKTKDPTTHTTCFRPSSAGLVPDGRLTM